MNYQFNFLDEQIINNSEEYLEVFSEKKPLKANVIDLFCGCGGLSLGFKREGFNVLAGLDNDETALKTYKHNLNATAINTDLGNPNYVNEIKEHINDQSVDVIIGGPPCQGFSLTGTRLLNDPRNSLFKSFFNSIDEFNPKFVLLENVKGMNTLYGGVVIKQINSEFELRGYNTVSALLNASDFGVPQNRERFFIIASKTDKKLEMPKPILKNEFKISCKDALSDLHDFQNSFGEEESNYQSKPKSFYQRLMRLKSTILFNHVGTAHKQFVIDTIKLVPDGGNHKDLPEGVGTSRRFNEAWTRYNSKKPSKTIDTGHRNHFHYEFNRVPTVRENARLQSFPDDFVFIGSKTNQNKQVGNAVPVFLSQAIAMHIKSYLK